MLATLLSRVLKLSSALSASCFPRFSKLPCGGSAVCRVRKVPLS
jgi:hypothetical protein